MNQSTLPALVLTGLMTVGVHAENWPQWRGPDGLGISAETDVPIRWSAHENMVWRAALAGTGTSTPVVWDDQIFLTSQIGGGPVDQRGAQFTDTQPEALRASDGGTVSFVVQAFDRASGRQTWEYRLPAESWLPSVHRNHNLATPSVVTDGEMLYAWFGTGQLVALDLGGAPVWSRHIGQEYAPFDILWGHGSSPQLYHDLVILLCDHSPMGYLIALDKRTGHERWIVNRGPFLRSYSTPLVMPAADGDQLIVNSNHWIDAYDPDTGRSLWRAGAPVELAAAMPVHENGVLYTSRGYSSGPYFAVETGGQGDVSDTHIRWRHATRAPYISSLLLYRNLIYMATETGILTVTDPASGEPTSRRRLGGVFTASPVAADGHVYFVGEAGETVVLEAGREPRVAARNDLGERSLASPAISGGRIYIRTDEHLWCIGNAGREAGTVRDSTIVARTFSLGGRP